MKTITKMQQSILMRTAMMLLLMVLTSTTAWAELNINILPDKDAGTVTVDGRKVYVTPAAAYYLKSAQWTDGTNVITLTLESVASTGTETPYYLAPSENGTVTVTFEAKSDDVLVTFDLNGYRGNAPADQSLKIGGYATLPTPAPTSAFADFVGWYTDSKGTTPYDFTKKLDYSLPYDIASAKSKLKLYAKWTAHSYNGACGKVDKKLGLDGWEVTWEASKSTGSDNYDVLTISGNGEMEDYKYPTETPWYNYRSTIKQLDITEGVTSIGKNAFRYMGQLGAKITIPASVTTIRVRAFLGCHAQTITFAEGSKPTSIEDNAFDSCSELTTVTISSNVTSIGNNVFQKCAALRTVDFAEGSQLTSIGKNAFSGCSALTTVTIPANVISIGNNAFLSCKALTTVNFAAGSQLQTIGANAFDGSYSKKETPVLSSVGTLPASVNSIGVNAFRYYTGDHLYITVPAGKLLSVKSKKKDVTPPVSNNLADLLACHFTKLVINRTSTQPLAIAMTDGVPHNINITLKKNEGGTITTIKENAQWAYSFDAKQISSAPVNETVVLSWGDEEVPKGKYVSSFTFDVDGVSATPNEDCTEYTFNMPDQAVNVTGWLSDQEEYTLDLTEDGQVALTETQYMLMYTLMGYANHDNTLDSWCIDLNLDGKPDLQMIPPVEEDEETDREDGFVNEYSVKRLAGADDVTKNYHFAFKYPFPYRYNGMLVKLNEDYPEAVQPKLEDIDDDTDNSGTFAEWANDGNKHNVILTRRTLYRDNKWNTLCLPFDVTISGSPLDLPGVEAHKLTEASISGTKLNLTFSDAVTELEAGVPYIIKWATATKNIVEPVFYDVTIPDMGITEADRQDEYYWDKLEARVADFYASKGYDNGASKGAERVRFVGTYKSTTFNAEDKSILLLGGDNKLYYPKSGIGIGAQRAYFKLGDDNAQARQLTDFSIEFRDGETTTSLSPIPSSKGKGEVYDLQGRRVAQPTTKGLYIMNGKKYVIK